MAEYPEPETLRFNEDSWTHGYIAEPRLPAPAETTGPDLITFAMVEPNPPSAIRPASPDQVLVLADTGERMAVWYRDSDSVTVDWQVVQRFAQQPGPSQGFAKLLLGVQAMGKGA